MKLTNRARFEERGNPESTESPAEGNRTVIEATTENKIVIGTEGHFSSAVKYVQVVTQ